MREASKVQEQERKALASIGNSNPWNKPQYQFQPHDNKNAPALESAEAPSMPAVLGKSTVEGAGIVYLDRDEYYAMVQARGPDDDHIDAFNGFSLSPEDLDRFQKQYACLECAAIGAGVPGSAFSNCARSARGSILHYFAAGTKCTHDAAILTSELRRLKSHKNCLINQLNLFYLGVYRSFLKGGAGCYLSKVTDTHGTVRIEPLCDLSAHHLQENPELTEALRELYGPKGAVRKAMMNLDQTTLSAGERELVINFVLLKRMIDQEDPAILKSVSFIKGKDFTLERFQLICNDAKQLLDGESKPLQGEQLTAMAQETTVFGVRRAQPTPPSP